jgi:hypothetical protein
MMQIKNITHLSHKNEQKIQKIIQPLFDQFGITFFGASEVSDKGYWSENKGQSKNFLALPNSIMVVFASPPDSFFILLLQGFLWLSQEKIKLI